MRDTTRFDCVSGVREPPEERDTSSPSQVGNVRSLAAITEHARIDGAVRKQDLRWGDRVIVHTRNSIYSIWSLGDDAYVVSGGWFENQPERPSTVRINGCTYGGSAIRHDVVAAPGLFLEFGNNVLTTRIRDVRVVRYRPPHRPN